MTSLLQPNAVMTYGQGVANVDGTVTLNLTCAQPGEGSGLPGSFVVTLSTADVTTITNAVGNAAKKAALDAIVIAYIKAVFRLPASVAAVQASLNAIVGLTVTVA